MDVHWNNPKQKEIVIKALDFVTILAEFSTLTYPASEGSIATNTERQTKKSHTHLRYRSATEACKSAK